MNFQTESKCWLGTLNSFKQVLDHAALLCHFLCSKLEPQKQNQFTVQTWNLHAIVTGNYMQQHKRQQASLFWWAQNMQNICLRGSSMSSRSMLVLCVLGTSPDFQSKEAGISKGLCGPSRWLHGGGRNTFFMLRGLLCMACQIHGSWVVLGGYSCTLHNAPPSPTMVGSDKTHWPN